MLHRIRLLLWPLVLLMALALPAATNEDDAGFLARQLQSLLSDAGREVRIRGFEGALSSRATMREMVISDDEGPWLILHDAALDWSRAALLSRRVEVNELIAGHIELLRPPVSDPDALDLPSPTARAPFALPDLPVSIRIGTLRADRVSLGPAFLGEAAELRLEGSARLEDGEGTARFEAARIDGQQGAFRVAGAFDNTTRRLQLDIALTEGPGGIAATALGIPGEPPLSLTVQGDDPIEAFDAEIALATDGQDRVTGHVVFTDTSPDAGLLDGAEFRLALEGDLRPLLAPDLHAFFGAQSQLSAEARRDEDGALSLRQLVASTEALDLRGEADLSPSGVPERIDLRLDLAGPGREPVLLPGTGGDGRVERAELTVEFDAAEGPEWHVLGRLTRLSLPDLDLAQVLLDARGALAYGAEDQPADAPLFDGIVEFTAAGLAAADPALQSALGPELYGLISLVAPADGGPLLLQGMTIETDTVVLTGHGQLSGVTFDGAIEAEARDLAPFSGLAGRPLGGQALVELQGQVNPVSGAFDLQARLDTNDLRLAIPEADNLLAGRARIDTALRRDLEGTELERLTIEAGTFGLNARGRIRPDDVTALTARARLSDLSRLGPGYAGALGLDLDYHEAAGLRRVQFEGEVSDLALADLPGAAQIRGLLRGRTALDGLLTERDGTVEIERLRLDGGQIALDLSGTASAEAQDLVARLDRLALTPLGLGVAGDLAGEASVSGQEGARRVALDVRALGPLRTGQPPVDQLLARNVTLRAEAREAGGDLLLDSARLTGAGLEVQANGAQRADGALTAELDGRLEAIGRLAPGLDGTAGITARLARPAGAQDIDTRVTLTGPSGLALNAEGRVQPDPLRLALSVSGGVDAALANPFIAPSTVQGQVSISGDVSGPPELGALRLSMQARNARFIMPGQGIAFQNVSADATLSGLRLGFGLRGESMRGGTIRAEGSLDLSGRRQVELMAMAERFRILSPGLLEGSVSGAVRLQGPLDGGPTASGSITIDEVEIRIPNSPLGRAGHVPPGIRHVGEAAASRTTRERAGILRTGPDGAQTGAGGGGIPIFLDLTLEAPGRVFVRGRGLDAELGGRLQLGGSTRDVIPAGAFSLLRGRMDLLGNRFTLTEGTASMMGSFMPMLRLVASTESGGTVTSIVLEGPADAPEIRFESVPELPEDEVLARLIFGRGLTSLSPFQAAQLAMSVATLTGRSEGGLLERSRTALGLDDLDLTTDDAGNTAVRAGRYLGENVYADVGISSSGESEVRLQLDLTPSLTLRGRTDSGGRSGLGVFFERDY